MNNSRQILRAALLLSRNYNKAPLRQTSSVPSKYFGRVKKLQEQLGTEDGVPVYLKSGFKDRALFLFTLGLTAVGLGMSVETMYRLTVK